MAGEVALFKMANNRNFEFTSQTSAKLVLHIFQDLNKHHLRFHALVWLHKQLSSTTSFCLSTCWPSLLREGVKDSFPTLRSARPSKLTILYNLVCGSGCSAFKLHAIGFKGEGEQNEYTAGLESRTRVPWALAACQSQSLQMNWTLSYSCCCPEDTNLKPKLTLFQASGGHRWQGHHWWNREQ